MKKFIVFFIFCASLLLAEIQTGKFSNLTTSPATGDMGGSRIILIKNGTGITGTLQEAYGELSGPLPLGNLVCDDNKSACTFTIKGDPDRSGKLLFHSDFVILIIGENKGQLLFKNGKNIVLSPEDTFQFTRGTVRDKPEKDAKILKKKPELFTRVKVKQMMEDYMMEVEFNGKTAFIEYTDFGDVRPQAIMGDRVRFRASPSTGGKIIQEFSKWTIVGVLFSIDEKWTLITYKGKIGYVAKDYLTGY